MNDTLIFDAALTRMGNNELRAASDSYEAVASESERRAREEQAAADEIREAFALIGKVPLDRIALPEVQARSSGGFRVGSISVKAACLDMIQDWQADAELTEIIEKSECPYVAKLRKVLEDKYIKGHATDIAEYRI